MGKKEIYSKSDDERYVAMSIKPTPDKRIKRRKAFLILAYSLLVAAWGILLGVWQIYAVYLATFSVLSLFIFIFFTWRFTKIEYEIAIDHGELKLTIIYGELTRKELFSCRVKELSKIASYSGDGKIAANQFQAKKVYNCAFSKNSESALYATYEGKKKVLFIFEAEEKVRKMMKYYNSTAYQV